MLCIQRQAGAGAPAPDTAALALQTSFHYEGYNFDSAPEAEFLDWTLELLHNHPHQIEGLRFSGGLTDAGKTGLRDFIVGRAYIL